MENRTAVRYVPRIDEATCIGQGDCADIAPRVFEVNDVATVVGEGVPDEILAAAEACPVGAITVIDAATGDEVYP